MVAIEIEECQRSLTHCKPSTEFVQNDVINA